MSAVIRLGYVHLRVTDLEEARNHYSNTLGMEVVATEPGKLYLKCWDEWDHHSLVLEEGGVGLVKLGIPASKCDRTHVGGSELPPGPRVRLVDPLPTGETADLPKFDLGEREVEHVQVRPEPVNV